jgi:putative peptidoglycan lipid II flippase
MLPASIGFMVLASRIVATIFGGGRFDAASVNLTSRALFFYSIGLFAYGTTKILQSCFFAMRDTVTPTKIAFIALVLNIILNSILMFPLKIAGIALATSISAIISMLILFNILRKRLEGWDIKEVIISFLRIMAASIAMGLACYLFSQSDIISGTNALVKFFNLGLLLIIGLISYVAFCLIFRVKEMRELWGWVAGR